LNLPVSAMAVPPPCYATSTLTLALPRIQRCCWRIVVLLRSSRPFPLRGDLLHDVSPQARIARLRSSRPRASDVPAAATPVAREQSVRAHAGRLCHACRGPSFC
jgi:hypothetical protein